MNIKSILESVIPVLIALVLYRLVVEKMLDKYDDTFDGKEHFDA